MWRYVPVCLAVVACMDCACSRSAQTYLDRGNHLFAQGKYAAAALEYRKSIAQNRRSGEAYYRLAITDLELNHAGEALVDFQRAVDLDPTNDMYRIQLANLSFLTYQADSSNQRLYNAVAQEAERLLQRNPNSFDGLRL